MGIVKISDRLHEDLRLASQAMARSVNAQAEFWMRLGMLAELYPDLNYNQLKIRLLKAESGSLKEWVDELDQAQV
ncbi:ParD-like family protein [Marinospirillum alkaliphilum]|uniref:ParD-like antitoxin of type II toxin-antitoxin system n=1 Tax=Marinospirillum alkaliphilum DSM 21637 TaxID=1122209 RepID=A0A1K1YIA0_9GAMM|nr:ParD-like family protein [Marinospirillum alkaliphilum]SFX61656.1 ParD-like antitoxin of type II toxin-antitoxin system [Marinospirillum alkaliphilum DSM 21637]